MLNIRVKNELTFSSHLVEVSYRERIGESEAVKWREELKHNESYDNSFLKQGDKIVIKVKPNGGPPELGNGCFIIIPQRYNFLFDSRNNSGVSVHRSDIDTRIDIAPHQPEWELVLSPSEQWAEDLTIQGGPPPEPTGGEGNVTIGDDQN